MFRMNTKDIKIADYDYPLPDERVARHPLEIRDACKLLVASPEGLKEHTQFAALDSLLSPDTLMVCNETRVINARMEFFKESGARIEVFLLEPSSPSDYALNFAATSECSWVALVGNRKRWKSGPLSKIITLADGREVRLEVYLDSTRDESAVVRFVWESPDDTPVSFAEIVQAAGAIPIPPYLNRASEATDATDYQTVYSRVQGSVAAPTAGLHFTDALMQRLRHKGITISPLTLHVGAGTFQPVKSDLIGEHPMHTEWVEISRTLINNLLEALRAHRPILAVGTTSVRTLESLPYIGARLAHGADLNVTQWEAYEEAEKWSNTPTEGREEALRADTIKRLEAIQDYMATHGMESLTASTAIMIAPGFGWRIVDRMVTNFHQPQSTLLLLVSSFLQRDGLWRELYNEALSHGYRFLSYGDACLFSRK